MKYFIDSEFLDDGETINLFSIGIKADDGREYYAVNQEADFNRVWCDHKFGWFRENVMPTIDVRGDGKAKYEIAKEVEAFCTIPEDPPEFWGYYASYDWVAFCQLWGPMLSIPRHFPKYIMDVKQYAKLSGVQLPPNPKVHHALEDARWIRQAYHCVKTATVSQVEQARRNLALEIIGVK